MLLLLEEVQKTWEHTGFEKCKKKLLVLFKGSLTKKQLDIIHSLKED
jgi:hypothetical protein